MKLVFDPSTVVVKTLSPKPMLFPSHQWSFHGARWDLRESTGVILGRFKHSGFKHSGFSFHFILYTGFRVQFHLSQRFWAYEGTEVHDSPAFNLPLPSE